MDKLKPILAQKFWIFFGLVLILPLVGYFMTRGELAAQIKTQWEKLDNEYKGIPTGTDAPNESWSKGLEVLNEQLRLHNRVANEALWRAQRERMRWPDEVAAVMNKAEYFKPVPPEQGGLNVPFKYQQVYPREIRRLWEIVDPLEDGKNVRDSSKRRKMSFAMADLHIANMQRWEPNGPTFAEIWASQEDIWLQTELLQAVARVNANAISQGDAFIKQMGKIVLFGGARSTGDVSAAASSNPLGGGSDMPAGPFGGMPGMGGAGGRSDASKLTVDIPIAEEFDAAIEQSGDGFSGGGATFGAIEPESSGGTVAGLGGGGLGGAQKTDVKRYIDDDETRPFKRRGFYIKLIMDHRKVPDLIAELMNSPFPVEIIRVHQVWYTEGGTTTGGSGSPFLGGGGGAASPFGAFAGPRDTDAALTPPTSGTEEPESTAGFGAPSSGFGGSGAGGAGAAGSGSAAAMADPNLAHVAILGVWTLYRPPAPAADAGQAAPANPSNPPATPSLTPNPDAPAQPNPSAPTEPAKPTTTDPMPADTNQPETSDTPKADAAKPTPSESTDPPTSTTNPTNDQSSDTPKPESN